MSWLRKVRLKKGYEIAKQNAEKQSIEGQINIINEEISDYIAGLVVRRHLWRKWHGTHEYNWE